MGIGMKVILPGMVGELAKSQKCGNRDLGSPED